jgi:hypothetical protein
MYNLPFFEAEAVISEINARDARDLAHPLFNIFQPRGQTASKIKLRTMTRRAGQLRHTTWGGRAVPVQRGEISERLVEPAVLKVFDHLTQEDVQLFTQAEAALRGNEVEGATAPAVVEALDRIQRLAADLGDDMAEERHRLMVGACLGSVDVLVYDATTPTTIDYGLTSIPSPATPWDNPAATIVADIEKALNTFRDNNTRGLSATHVLYSPHVYGEYFAGNTQWNTYVKQVPSMAQGFLRVPGGLNPFEPVGDVSQNLFGLTWVKVEGTYRKQNPDGTFTITPRWPTNTLVFLNLAAARPRWQMVLHPWMNPRPEVNVEVKMPAVGDDVKEVTVTAFYNGIPLWEDPTCVQVWEVAA